VKGWQLEGGETIRLDGEWYYVRDARGTMGNIIYLELRGSDGVLTTKQVLTEQEVETR
jgi:hypothetical protein